VGREHIALYPDILRRRIGTWFLFGIACEGLRPVRSCTIIQRVESDHYYALYSSVDAELPVNMLDKCTRSLS
jgi:hypothetical protein